MIWGYFRCYKLLLELRAIFYRFLPFSPALNPSRADCAFTIRLDYCIFFFLSTDGSRWSVILLELPTYLELGLFCGRLPRGNFPVCSLAGLRLSAPRGQPAAHSRVPWNICHLGAESVLLSSSSDRGVREVKHLGHHSAAVILQTD